MKNKEGADFIEGMQGKDPIALSSGQGPLFPLQELKKMRYRFYFQ